MNAAYDRRYAAVMLRRGAKPPVERVTGRRWPAAPLSSAERVAAWRRRYDSVPIEVRNKPVRKHPRAVFVQRTRPEPLHTVVPMKRRA